MHIYAVYEMLMNRRLVSYIFALPFLLVSCLSEEGWQGSPAVPDGYVSIRFSADVPAMQEVVTRAVDYDGGGIQNMTLFCFDSYGLFISTVSASLSPKTMQTGTFTATVPEYTRTIHFVANQNMNSFAEDDFRSKSEAEVMSLLEGSSGKMIYWSRFKCNENDDSPIDDQLQASGAVIEMIRNHALVSVQKESDAVDFEITGFVVCNTNAFGTVAPFHPQQGFDFIWPGTEDFVTLPLNRSKMSDIKDVTTELSQYIFETENGANDPVSAIVRGHSSGEADQYFRVLLIDDNGDQLLIRRNHHYILNIQDALSYGQDSFAEALSAPATNNVWISISDDVTEVQNSEYVLSVNQTAYVLEESYAGKTFAIDYTLKRLDGSGMTESDKPAISWLDNNVAAYGFSDTFTITGDTGKGRIVVNLNQLGGNDVMLQGTLLLKKGKHQRTVKLILIKEQQFIPSWVGTQVYAGTLSGNVNRAKVTAVFTIPESCPEELFPMNVYVSVDELDVRSESGMQLAVVTAGSDGYYGVDNGVGYKYVYVAEKPGVQRIYFENKLSQEDGHEGHVMFEAPYFETLTKSFKYSGKQYAITVSGLYEYGNDGTPLPGGYAEDEVIYYCLVPQKRYADVQFDMVMMDLENDRPFNVGDKDEFLLYSSNLDYYKDGETTEGGISDFDCTFYDVDSSVPSSDGRILMFKPNEAGRSEYSIYMKTNRPVSAEVVRISSNQREYNSMLPGAGETYSGNMYRSIIFELANYRPFRFAARINGIGNTEPEGPDEEESVDYLDFSYEPGQKVDIEIDITSFTGADGKSVNPFGEEFEIYIDAPMLSIDEGRLASCNLTAGKLKEDSTVPGRFVYTVDRSRENERNYGMSPAIKPDAGGADQTGERKTLPFVTAAPVSAGDIVISSNAEKVVFFTKTFTVSNNSIEGLIQYERSGNLIPVPKNAFVPFELIRDNSRIGSVTIVEDGSYELRLRREYQFNWYSDPVQILYETGGEQYTASFQSLSELFGNTDIILMAAGSDGA